jgi:6-phosphogluconolactonase
MNKSVRSLLFLTLAIAIGLAIGSHAQTNPSSHAVFVMTNSATRNQVIAFAQAGNGSIEEHQFATGGRGSGGTTDPLGSQGSLTLTQDHSFLLAVNAGSGEISVFKVHGAELTLTDRVLCGGSEPVAVTEYNHVVYVANAGGNSNVTGFNLNPGGKLTPIQGSTSYLSTSNSGPGSVTFSPDGKFLLVTEKVTNNIDVFPVQSDGKLGSIVINPSAGPGAFAVSFATDGTALVSETGPMGVQNAGALSSYAVQTNGTLSVISASVPTMGTATCWQAITPNSSFVYTANSGSSTISGFSIGKNGALTALSGTVVATLPSGSTDLDTATSSDGKLLFTLDSGTGKVSVFDIDSNGDLSSVGAIGNFPPSAGFNGIAAN